MKDITIMKEYNSTVLNICNQVNVAKYSLNPDKYTMVTLFFPRCLKINPIVVVEDSLEDCLFNVMTIAKDFYIAYSLETKKMINELPLNPVTKTDKAKLTMMKKVIKERVYMFLEAYFTIDNKPEEYMANSSKFNLLYSGGFSIENILESLEEDRKNRNTRKQRSTKVITIDCLGKYEIPKAM